MSARKKVLPEKAQISILKTHLGQYLKKVQGGAEVTVYDRQVPVAKIVPFLEPRELLIRKPTRTWAEVFELFAKNDRKRPARKLDKSVLEYLQEDRKERGFD